MKTFDALKKIVLDAEEEAAKFEGGNKAAGTRLRKAMMAAKGAAQAVRTAVSEEKAK